VTDFAVGTGWLDEFINAGNRPAAWHRAKIFRAFGGRLNSSAFVASCRREQEEVGNAPTEDDALSFWGWTLGMALARGVNVDIIIRGIVWAR
jgi:hypothetical protein